MAGQGDPLDSGESDHEASDGFRDAAGGPFNIVLTLPHTYSVHARMRRTHIPAPS